MKFISYAFFYSYIGVVLLAGFWGAFIDPAYDFKLLYHVDISTLPDAFRINLLSQYRFLRAIELGFGLFSVCFVKEIFSIRKFNYVFLAIMACGIMGRTFSAFIDGHAFALMYFFLFFELTAIIFIFIYSKTIKLSHTNAPSTVN